MAVDPGANYYPTGSKRDDVIIQARLCEKMMPIPPFEQDEIETDLVAGRITPLANHPLVLPCTEAPHRWTLNGFHEPICTGALRANTRISLIHATDFSLLLKRELIRDTTTVRPETSKITGIVIHNKALGFIHLPAELEFEISQVNKNGLINVDHVAAFVPGTTNTHGHTPHVLTKLWQAGIYPAVMMNITARLDQQQMLFQASGAQTGSAMFHYQTCRTKFTREEQKTLTNVASGFTSKFTDFVVVGVYVDLDTTY